VPVSAGLSFSRELWRPDAEFFRALGPPLLARDAWPAFQPLAALAGFGPDNALEALCRWHEARLAGPGWGG
jgi:hypothetical protein